MKKLKYTVAFLLLANALALADDVGWHLLVEPAFLHDPVSWPIASVKPSPDGTASESEDASVVLVPARLVGGEVAPMTASEARQLHATQESVEAATLPAASQLLATLKPEYVRGDNHVIQYAILQSDSPFTASVVLAPGFADKFADTLGPDILIAIPNRNRIFVFPKLSQGFRSLADVIIGEYETSPHPVSREVFQIRKGKLIAIGSYR